MDTSDSNLKMGLQLVGRQTLGVREWTGKFAEKQLQHQYPAQAKQIKTKFGTALTKSFQKMQLHTQTCALCLSDKLKSQFYKMCKCSHSYCYSCLNSYAISRIQDSTPVVCPSENCSQIMNFSSKIYHYLPDQIKIKYLQDKSTFKTRKRRDLKKEQAEKLCQRCLQSKHIGQCKYVLSYQSIDKSFQYRQCPKCKVEINVTEGKRKIKCSKCSNYSCYLCGKYLTEKQNHDCSNRGQIVNLEKQYTQSRCCACSTACDNCDCDCCCNCQCNCDCDCCSQCTGDFCCEILFYFEADCSLFCMLWNLLSIPIRLALSSIIFAMMMGLGGMLLCMGTAMWFVVCMFGAICPIPMEIICDDGTPGAVKFLMILFYPITILFCFGLAIKESHQIPCEVFANFFGMYCSMLGGIWVELSPSSCLDD